MLQNHIVKTYVINVNVYELGSLINKEKNVYKKDHRNYNSILIKYYTYINY